MTLHTVKRQLKAYLFHSWCVDEQKERLPPPGAVVAFFCDSGAGYKTADLLTYYCRCYDGLKYQINTYHAYQIYHNN